MTISIRTDWETTAENALARLCSGEAASDIASDIGGYATHDGDVVLPGHFAYLTVGGDARDIANYYPDESDPQAAIQRYAQDEGYDLTTDTVVAERFVITSRYGMDRSHLPPVLGLTRFLGITSEEMARA